MMLDYKLHKDRNHVSLVSHHILNYLANNTVQKMGGGALRILKSSTLAFLILYIDKSPEKVIFTLFR